MNHTKSKLSGMISKGFKADKCKVSLRMAMSRMKLLRNKREVQVRQMKRDVAQLLQSGQNQTARIRVEHVIREEKTMAAYELLELYCELIVARLTIIDSQKTCPIDLREAISSVIFATPRCADVLELTDVQKQLVAKYGKEFASAALELRPDCGVSHMVIEKLSAKAPDMETKIKTLKSIAEEHGVEWDAKALLDELQKQKNDLLGGSGSQVRLDYPAASDVLSSTQPKPTQFLSASQVAMGYSANDSSTGSVQTPSQSKPTPFLSASQVATGYSANDSSPGSVQTSSQSKPAQFLSASEVMMDHSDTSSSTGQSSLAQKKDGGTSEGDFAKPPDDQVYSHGGIISSTGSIIYPPPPPPFMKFEESAPSHTQPEFTSPDGSPRQKITELKYKDAKEAAREAAKSAERAQMAARAAAELARQEKRARGKTQVEENTYNMPRVGSVEGGHKQSETENLDMHNHQVVQDSQSNGEEEEEEEIIINAIGPDRGNEYDVYWDKHEPSSVAVFDQSDSDMDDHSPNLLDTLSHSLQPKKGEYASDFYWREKADSKKHDIGVKLTNDSSPPPFVDNSAPTFDSDGISSDDESKGDIKASKEQPKYIHSEEREEETEFPVGMKNTRVSSDDDNDKPKIDLNFERLTGGFKNKGYRRTPYIKKPIINVTPSAETLDNHEVHVSPRTKNTPTLDINEAKASSKLSVETGKGRRGSKNLASRFDTNYFDTEDEVEEPENQQVQDTGRLVNRNIIKHSRRTRGTPTSETRKKDNIKFGEDRQPESSDEEKTNKSAVTEKTGLEEDEVKSSAVTEKTGLEEDEVKSSASPSSVRYRRPPDYDSLAAHFRSLRTNRS